MDESITLKKIINEVWKLKFLIIVVFIFFIILSSVYLRVASYQYTISFQVVPVQHENSETMMSSLGKNVSGLASIIGFNPNIDNNEGYFELYKSLIKSRIIADIITKDEEFLKSLFPDYWDEKENKWKKPNKTFLSSIKNFIKLILGAPIYHSETLKPSAEMIAQFLSEEISIYTEADSQITYISMYTTNPEIGIILLTNLNNYTDNYLKNREYRKSLINIKSIKKQIAETINSDHKMILFEKLAVEETRKLSSSSDLPFSAERFGNVYSSDRPTKPRISMTIFSFLVLALLFNIIFITVRIIIKYY